MFCPFCGAQIPDNAKVCPQCGSTLKSTESTSGTDGGSTGASGTRQTSSAKSESRAGSKMGQTFASAVKTAAHENATQSSLSDDPDEFRNLSVVFDGERVEVDRVVVSTDNIACAYLNVPRFPFPWLAVAGCVFLILIDLVGFHTMYCLVAGLLFLAIVLIMHFVRVSTSVKSVVLRMSSGDSVLVQSTKIATAAHELMPLLSASIKTRDVHQSVTVPNARVRVEESGRHPLGL